MKISDQIHLLKIDFEIAISPDKKLPRFVNVLVIFGDKITLVDSGVKGSEEKIMQYIETQGRSFAEIETLVLSHAHPDHIGSAAKIKELTGCKVLAHKAEQEWIENIEIQNQQRPVPGFFNLVNRSVKVDELLNDGQLIQIAGGPLLKIIHSPGHSKGSVNIEFVNEKMLFTADSVPLKNDIPNYDNFHGLMKSLEKITTSDFGIFLSSWTPPLFSKAEISRLLDDGRIYMLKIDATVKECYQSNNETEACKLAVEKLGLPPFLANQLVNASLKSHL